MTTRRILLSIVVATALLAGAFIAGRYSRPARIETVNKVQVKTEYVDRWHERIVYLQKKAVAKHVETRVERKADGSSVTTRVEDSKSVSSVAKDTDRQEEKGTKTDLSSESKTLTVTERARYSLGVGMQLQVADLLHGKFIPKAEVGAGVRALGPLWVRGAMTIESKPTFTLRLEAEF